PGPSTPTPGGRRAARIPAAAPRSRAEEGLGVRGWRPGGECAPSASAGRRIPRAPATRRVTPRFLASASFLDDCDRCRCRSRGVYRGGGGVGSGRWGWWALPPGGGARGASPSPPRPPPRLTPYLG